MPQPTSTDYESIHQWHARRKANDELVARTKREVEPHNLNEAIECYRKALQRFASTKPSLLNARSFPAFPEE